MGCGGGKQKTSVPARSYSLSFAWPATGQVHIKTVKFRAEFDQKTQEIVIKLSDSRITESQLTWERGHFSLRDEMTYDKITKKTQETPGIAMDFDVSSEGRFEELKEADELLERLVTSQKVTLPAAKAEKAKGKLLSEVKSQWSRWVEMWLTPHTGTEISSCGKACVELNYSKQQSDIDAFLEQKYGESADNFILTEASHSVAAVAELKTLRPHRVRMRRYRYLCLDIQGKQVREMWEEASLTLFCWEDLPETRDANYLKEHWDILSEQVNKLVEVLNQRVDYVLHPPASPPKPVLHGVVEEALSDEEESQNDSEEAPQQA